MKLRSHLVLLVLAATLPLLMFGGIMIWQEIGRQREAVERGMRDTVRALALAVDREVGVAKATVEVLATSQALARDDFKAFYEQCAALTTPTHWFVLSRPDGQQVVNTLRPFGAPLPKSALMNIIRTIVATKKPMISDVFIGAAAKRPIISIAVPVVRDGQVIYVFNVTSGPERFDQLLRQQALTADWQATILDRQGVFVARRTDPDKLIGQQASSELVSLVGQADEGSGAASNAEGTPVAVAFAKSQLTGWSVAIAAPQAAIAAQVNRSIVALASGAALLLLLGLGTAYGLGRRIAEPLMALANRAHRLQGGEPVELKRAAVREVKDLNDALTAAGATARAAALERERRLVAEARQAEIIDRDAQLRAGEERLRAFLENSATIAWMKDEAGRYVYVSDNYCTRLQAKREDFVGKSDFEIWPQDIAEQFRRNDLAALARKGSIEVVEKARNPDGSEVYWFNSKFVMTDSAGRRYVGGLGVDITERVRLEGELQKRLGELKEADRRKDEFIATLSHELRNPLAPIRNAVQVLKTIGPAEPKLQWCRDLIDQQVSLMARLMEDLLDVSRITRDKLELRKQLVELRAVIDDAVAICRPQIDAGGHRLAVDLPEEKIVLDGDPARLTQVFSNLVNNAAKYCERNGSIEIRAKFEPILDFGLPILDYSESEECNRSFDTGQDRAQAVDNSSEESGFRQSKILNQKSKMEVAVSVLDAGIGIAPEKLPHVFDMFFQAESGQQGRHGGLGIGLTLVRNLVELHGGTVEAKSAGLGQGSEFIVRLPVVQVELPVAQRKLEVASMAQQGGGKVVIVDDNKMQAQSLAMLLELIGYQVRTAHDGASAIAVITEFQPKVALIDIGLPEMNGYELAARLRELPQLSGLILIAQTGWGREEDKARAKQAGFDHHLTKPIDHVLLEKILDSAAT